MSTSICGPCKRALHDGCRGAEYCDCNHVVSTGPEVIESDESNPDKRERRHKPDAALKDQQSTGRKRAAENVSARS
jgi:hypothetical protein